MIPFLQIRHMSQKGLACAKTGSKHRSYLKIHGLPSTPTSWLPSPFRGLPGVYRSQGPRALLLSASRQHSHARANLVVCRKTSPTPYAKLRIPSTRTEKTLRDGLQDTPKLDELSPQPSFTARNKKLLRQPQNPPPSMPSHLSLQKQSPLTHPI